MTELELLHDFRYLTLGAGFAGGIALFFYMKPTNLTDAIIRVLVAILATNMLTDIVSHKLIGDVTNGETWGIAFLIGFVSWPLLGAVAKFFERRKDQDILEIAKSIKDSDIKK
jgi:ABC-type dipeptide/oligopeptide/nickel transport system permease subunit